MLLFSAMVVKNWRIYYIFTHGTKAKGHMTKDFVLLSMVLAMLLVNTGVLIAFSIVAKYQISNVIIDGDAWPVCASPASGTWIWILIAPISATLLFGLFISFFTRNVTSKFNESGQINMSIYIVTLSLIVLVPLSLTIKLPPTLHVINSLLVCLSLYTVIGANFFSKIYGSVVKPTEVMGLSGGGTGASSITSTGDSMLCCRTCNQPLTGAKKAVNSALMSANKTPA
ncbi:hypothetical protein BC829DRAFT_242883 [Chytridium lagenaria]|nr:hypothetical protein BC829DRAFT_242883 [Chytridium lagenaria]